MFGPHNCDPFPKCSPENTDTHAYGTIDDCRKNDPPGKEADSNPLEKANNRISFQYILFSLHQTDGYRLF